MSSSFDLWPKGGIRRSGIQIFEDTSSSGEADIRSEIAGILDGTNTEPQRGHWILLRRAETAQRCTCYNSRGSGDNAYSDDNRKYDEADENCTICDGMGWIYDDELHLTRKRITAPDIGLSTQEQVAPVGIMNVYYVVYYLKYNVNPSSKDKIIEIENDDDGNPVRPFNYLEEYNVSVVESLRDQKGRIEFWKVAVKMEVV